MLLNYSFTMSLYTSLSFKWGALFTLDLLQHLFLWCSLPPYPSHSRSGSTWRASSVPSAVCVSSSAAPQAQPRTAHQWVPLSSANTPWSPWATATCPTLWLRPLLAPHQPPARRPSAASWTDSCPCWFVAMTGSASTSAPTSRTCWD